MGEGSECHLKYLEFNEHFQEELELFPQDVSIEVEVVGNCGITRLGKYVIHLAKKKFHGFFGEKIKLANTFISPNYMNA